jgi:hypothetical protein
MEGMKKKLLEELIGKLSEMDDPLMGDKEEGEDECEPEGKGAAIKVMKISAEPLDEKAKKKLKMEV